MLVSYDKGKNLPCSRWDELEKGHRVLVQLAGEPLLCGEVDMRTADGSIFWIWLDGGRGRLAICAEEGSQVWLPES